MEPVKPVDPLRAPPPSSTYRKGEKKSKKKLKAHKMPSPHDTPPADQVFGTMSDAGSVVGMPVDPNYIDPMTGGYVMDPNMMAMNPNLGMDPSMMAMDPNMMAMNPNMGMDPNMMGAMPNMIDPMMPMNPNMAWDPNMINAGMGVMQPPMPGNGMTANMSYDPSQQSSANSE